MKNLLLVYNPFSGNRAFKNSLDDIIGIFEDDDFCVSVIRLNNKDLLYNTLVHIDNVNYFDTIVASGGDGTINIVINAIMKTGYNAKIGIIPSGTANDFASFLKIPKSYKDAANIITSGNAQKCDIGFVNGEYFINVFAGGLLSNISHTVDEDLKSKVGKLAYYIKGIEQIPNFSPVSLRITNSTEVIEDDFFLFFVLNSAGAGGFEKLVPDATIDDGYFDFVGIKGAEPLDTAILFLKILKNDYLDHDKILYFKDNYIKIELLSNNDTFNKSDTDGERGPDLPVEITNLAGAINIYMPK